MHHARRPHQLRREQHQFFKATLETGEKREAPLDSGFCPLIVAGRNDLVIPDTLADSRYSGNPVVTSTPFVRFYAGTPLHSHEGHILGTVCVLDQVPRELSESVLEALRTLGRQVEALLAARVSEALLKEREQRVRSLCERTFPVEMDFADKIQRLLQDGRISLGTDAGILARIDSAAGAYTVVQVDATSDGIPVGFTCPLAETFCSETVRRGPEAPPLAIAHAGLDTAWQEHPAYKTFGYEAYIAALVRVGGEPWGTLAFSSRTPRSAPFSVFDKDIVGLMAQWVGTETARQQAEEALRASAHQQRKFVRDMLASVTERKLRLCDGPGDLPEPLPTVSETIDLTPETLRSLRKRAEAIAEGLHLARERTDDLMTAVGEAGMNAIKHGGGGTGRVYADPARSRVQVWISDQGTGIRAEDLHRATLEKGWSGAGSFGHGFFLMLRTADRTYLLTGEQGTTVVLEQESSAPQPTWLSSITL